MFSRMTSLIQAFHRPDRFLHIASSSTKCANVSVLSSVYAGVMIGIAVFLMATGMCCVRYQNVLRPTSRPMGECSCSSRRPGRQFPLLLCPDVVDFYPWMCALHESMIVVTLFLVAVGIIARSSMPRQQEIVLQVLHMTCSLDLQQTAMCPGPPVRVANLPMYACTWLSQELSMQDLKPKAMPVLVIMPDNNLSYGLRCDAEPAGSPKEGKLGQTAPSYAGNIGVLASPAADLDTATTLGTAVVPAHSDPPGSPAHHADAAWQHGFACGTAAAAAAFSRQASSQHVPDDDGPSAGAAAHAMEVDLEADLPANVHPLSPSPSPRPQLSAGVAAVQSISMVLRWTQALAIASDVTSGLKPTLC